MVRVCVCACGFGFVCPLHCVHVCFCVVACDFYCLFFMFEFVFGVSFVAIVHCSSAMVRCWFVVFFMFVCCGQSSTFSCRASSFWFLPTFTNTGFKHPWHMPAHVVRPKKLQLEIVWNCLKRFQTISANSLKRFETVWSYIDKLFETILHGLKLYRQIVWNGLKRFEAILANSLKRFATVSNYIGK